MRAYKVIENGVEKIKVLNKPIDNIPVYYASKMSNEKQYYATPQYTIVGNPTIVNSVISNFSSNNYLTVNNAFNPLSNRWRAVFDITTGDNVTSEQYIFSSQQGNTNATRYGIRFGIQNGKFVFSPGIGNEFSYQISGGTVETNTRYIVSFGRSSTGRFIELFNGSSWDSIASNTNTSISSVLTNTRISGYTNYSGTWYAFNGSINLSNTYIILKDKICFKGNFPNL